MAKLTGEQYLGHLRAALNHLYDLDHLRRSPLLELLGIPQRLDAPAALQRILTEAIASLQPKGAAPAQSRAWRTYELLNCCYVQQLSQETVAGQLGMSVRQLRRERQAALEALAQQLWHEHDLEARLHQDLAPALEPPAAPADLSGELAWLKDATLESPTNLGEALRTALDLTRPLAARRGARIVLEIDEGLPGLAVHPVALGQILLNLLTVALRRASDRQVHVAARLLRWEVEVTVRCARPAPAGAATGNDDMASLQLAQQLASLCSGRVSVRSDEEALVLTAILPALERLPLLVVDDNADTLQLLRRYTAVTRYRLITSQDPEQTLALAEKINPSVIVLDVMMPQVDGWKVLERLRQHPRTGRIPIIVCTILAQEELALSLGASAFLRKPLTRQAFLAALEQVLQGS